MKINDDSIQEMLLPYKEEGEQEPYYCYGVIMGTVGQTALLGPLAAFANSYYILGFTNKKLVMIPLDMLGKPKQGWIITSDYIKSVKVSSWFFGMGKKINIVLTDNSKIKLKINKKTFGIKKQRENLEAISDMLKNRF